MFGDAILVDAVVGSVWDAARRRWNPGAGARFSWWYIVELVAELVEEVVTADRRP
jgi:hypothetical protein